MIRSFCIAAVAMFILLLIMAEMQVQDDKLTQQERAVACAHQC